MKIMPFFGRHVLYAFAFSLFFTFIGCKKEPHKPDPARGSLQNQSGECLAKTVHGTWYTGFPANTDSNYIDVSVYVTHTGSYDLSTYRRNGVMFSASGNFTDTGLNVVRLKAIGSFLGAGELNYPLTFDSSTCQLHVDIQDSAGLSIADNTWQFTVAGHTYRGQASGPIYQLPQGAGYSFEFTGPMNADTALQMGFVTQYTDTLAHLTSQGAYLYFYTADNKTIYTANINTAPAVVDVHFRSFTTLPGPQYKSIAIGTFNGTVRDSANNILPITNAKFKLSN
jgi:hypothetical protein